MTTPNSTKGRPYQPSGPPRGTNLIKPIERLMTKIPTNDNTQGVIDV